MNQRRLAEPSTPSISSTLSRDLDTASAAALVASNNTSSITMEWTDTLENMAASMCDMGQVQLQLSIDSARYYDVRDRWLSLPVAIIGSVIATGIAVVQQRAGDHPQDSQIVMYVFSGLGILVTIMKIVNSIFGISEKKNKFENVRQQWERFVTCVSFELGYSRETRLPARTFFDKYVGELIQLQKSTPDVPAAVIQRFIRLYQGKKGTPQREEFHLLFKPFSFPSLRPASQMRLRFWTATPPSTTTTAATEDVETGRVVSAAADASAAAALTTKSVNTPTSVAFTPDSRLLDEFMNPHFGLPHRSIFSHRRSLRSSSTSSSIETPKAANAATAKGGGKLETVPEEQEIDEEAAREKKDDRVFHS